MTLSPQLSNAILALDAYNRGYDAGISTLPSDTNGTVLIGTAKIVDDLGDASAEDIGFYALAYDTDGDSVADVISYRGTDYPESGQTNNPPGVPNDINHGWTLGAGDLDSEQGQMAVEFYQAVVASGATNLSLAGHSLGGGLSGAAILRARPRVHLRGGQGS